MEDWALYRFLDSRATAANNADYRDMLALRDRVFAKRMEWDVRSENGLERDQYDAFNPVYFIARNSAGKVAGSFRLLPTMGPNMVRDTFPHLMNGAAVPASHRIWEMSRFAIDLEPPPAERIPIRHMFAAAIEFCYPRGIRGLIGVQDNRMRTITMRALGVRHPLYETEPHEIAGYPTNVGIYHLPPPERYRAWAGIEAPVTDEERKFQIRAA